MRVLVGIVTAAVAASRAASRRPVAAVHGPPGGPRRPEGGVRAAAHPYGVRPQAEPTPLVLVLTMPNDGVQMVRADADPTCAYAGAETTNGVEQFVPIGNDLREA